MGNTAPSATAGSSNQPGLRGSAIRARESRCTARSAQQISRRSRPWSGRRPHSRCDRSPGSITLSPNPISRSAAKPIISRKRPASALFSTSARRSITGLVISGVLGSWCKQPEPVHKADGHLTYTKSRGTIHRSRLEVPELGQDHHPRGPASCPADKLHAGPGCDQSAIVREMRIGQQRLSLTMGEDCGHDAAGHVGAQVPIPVLAE
jgi:hypothetical protein